MEKTNCFFCNSISLRHFEGRNFICDVCQKCDLTHYFVKFGEEFKLVQLYKYLFNDYCYDIDLRLNILIIRKLSYHIKQIDNIFPQYQSLDLLNNFTIKLINMKVFL